MTTLRHQYILWLSCVGSLTYLEAATMPDAPAAPRRAPRRMRGWEWRSRPHMRTRQTYRPERLQAELRADGFPAGIGRIKPLRKKLGLRCTQVRRFTTTTASNHALPGAENVLAQTFVATRPNETWVTDITDVPTAEGWLYLAGVKDLFTCEVVGHAMGGRMTTELVIQALGAAVWVKRPRPGLLHHSDREAQYGAQAYQDQLRQFGMTASMSRRGNCYNNAPMESFWGTLKNELVYHRRCDTRKQAQREITEYIEMFYNR